MSTWTVDRGLAQVWCAGAFELANTVQNILECVEGLALSGRDTTGWIIGCKDSRRAVAAVGAVHADPMEEISSLARTLPTGAFEGIQRFRLTALSGLRVCGVFVGSSSTAETEQDSLTKARNIINAFGKVSLVYEVVYPHFHRLISSQTSLH